MKQYKWFGLFLSFSLFAADPFHVKSKAQFKLDQKYQYLGYIKGPHLHDGFIRRSGGEVERLSFGKNIGLGQVVVLSKDRICLRKNNQIWCLLKSSQLRAWARES